MDKIVIKCSECGTIIPSAKYIDGNSDIVFIIEMLTCQCRYKLAIENRYKRDRESEVKP